MGGPIKTGTQNLQKIRNYVARVKLFLMNLNSNNLKILHRPLLKQMFVGNKRLYSEANKRERFFITRNIFLNLINEFNFIN